MLNQGLPIVISGPSGSGKGTIVTSLLARYPDLFALSVSATTRAPRPGEIDGTHYYFISREEFEHRIDAGEILEYTLYAGNYYGTPKKELHARTAAGINVILEIEVEGAMNVKRLCPDAVLIFVLPPDKDTLEARLRGRGTNSEEDIAKRLSRAREELLLAKNYDYIIVNENDGVDTAADAVASILMTEKSRTDRNLDKIKAFF